jgi:methylenetetrahydrofolate dehydrogenase (NADP+)/methenyltetrahydrofolate cyclohydrolase
VDSDASATELYDTIEELNADPEIHGILIQDAVPEHVDWLDAIRRIDPVKDIDGLHPENVGRLVAGDPRYKPCTPHGVQKLLASEDIDPEGKVSSSSTGRTSLGTARKPPGSEVDGGKRDGDGLSLSDDRSRSEDSSGRHPRQCYWCPGFRRRIDGDRGDDGHRCWDHARRN